ncbi:hypothetical protein HW132_35485 [Brasilonema sp. CT11]|nr:hypothetical protein [Brasilonema sp. CT11]
MAIRKPIFILLVNIVVFSLLFLFMASPGVDEEVGRFELQVHDHDDNDKSHPLLENSIFRVTRQGKAYDVNKNPDCWQPGCYERNNRHAYVACKKMEATEFNALGIKAVERWLGGDYVNSDSGLKDAIKHFLNAIKTDQYCAQPYANLGLVYLQLGRFDDAIKVWDQVSFHEFG